jgi:Stage II sporulation protein M
MDGSASAFVQGFHGTRATLSRWNRRPLPILGRWLAGSIAAAAALLVAVLAIGSILPGPGSVQLHRPPLQVGGVADAIQILGRNSLVLALHAMACVAGFIAGSSLPLQAREHTGVVRWLHERGGRLAIIFVVAATTFSLSAQAYVLGRSVARVAYALHATPGLLLLALAPHALPELVALFLPLAAWIMASRRGDWDQLLAATLVTVTIAVPVLVITALWEVFIAPHVLHALISY